MRKGLPCPPPSATPAVGGPALAEARFPEAPLVNLYRQYVVRFGLGYSEEPRAEVEIAGYPQPVRMRYAQPVGPLGY
nr:MAG: hypothetical protein DIU75_21280 [Mycolicibacterium hassiacum]